MGLKLEEGKVAFVFEKKREKPSGGGSSSGKKKSVS